MARLLSWLARWRSWRTRRQRARDIDDEIRAHLAMAAADHQARGASPAAAHDAAHREFGNVTLVRQSVGEVWAWTWWEQLALDVRLGARILRHAPGLSLTAVLLIALVIGANTTVYSMAHMLISGPATAVTAPRLVTVAQLGNRFDEPYLSYPDYQHYANRSQSVVGLAGWSNERFAVRTPQGTYAAFGALVSPSYFATLGVAVPLGRAIGPGDDNLAQAPLVAVISDRLWRERYAATADILTAHVIVNGQRAAIVGVAAPGFIGATLTPGEDVWLPIAAYYRAIGSTAVLERADQPLVLTVGRLAGGATRQRAQVELTTLAADRPRRATPAATPTGIRVDAYSATSLLPFGRMAPVFLAIFSVVTTLTLIVVSANVANLLLARAVARQRETAVRQSLGASRSRIVRMLLAEAGVLSLTAWAAACVCAWWTSQALLRLIEPASSNLLPDFRPDWWLAAYAMVLAAVAAVAFTIAPAVRTWRQPVLPLLKAGEQAIAQGRSRGANVLVVTQLAFSVLLLTSAGLAYRSLALVDSGDVGFPTANLLLTSVRSDTSGASIEAAPIAADRDAQRALLERVRERLAATPLFTAVSYTRRMPGAYFVSTTPVRRSADDPATLAIRRPVGPGYLAAMGVAPVAGRDLSERDRHGSTAVAVVSVPLAEALWPGRSPLGQTLLIGDPARAVEIIGVAPAALYDGPSRDPAPRFVFVAEQQTDDHRPDATFVIRYTGTLDAAVSAAGAAIASVDANVPIVATATMASRLALVMETERTLTTLLAVFAASSLLIATLGQYAVAAFNTRRRTRDFGVRLAIGASAAQIQRSVLWDTVRLTVPGLLLGVLASAALAAAVSRSLPWISPTDPATYAGVFALLAITSVAAALAPARRAARVRLIEALRQE